MVAARWFDHESCPHRTTAYAAFLNILTTMPKYNPASTNQAPRRRYVVTPSNTTELNRMCGCCAALARNTTTQHGQCASFLGQHKDHTLVNTMGAQRRPRARADLTLAGSAR